MSIFKTNCILACFAAIILISGCTDGDDSGVEDINNNGEDTSGDNTNEASCKDGAIKCDDTLSGIQGSIAYFVCKDGAWSEESTKCDDGLICSESDQKCITNPTPDCVEGEVLCVDDTTYQICDVERGFWSTGISTCENGTKCDKDQKKCVAAAE